MPKLLPIYEQDFDRLFEIEQAAHLVPWSLGTLKNNQGERYLNIKLLKNQEIIGFAICQKVLDEATLFNLAIDPVYQGQGWGKYLLEQLIALLRQHKVLTLWLEVRSTNQVAQKLYQQCGFNEVDIRKNYYPTPEGGREDAVVMACYL